MLFDLKPKKSPFNYVGNKYRIITELKNIFPKSINTFYDVFGGSGTVSLNMTKQAKQIVYNDNIFYVKQCLEIFAKHKNIKELINELNEILNLYQLSKTRNKQTNEEGYRKLRADFNNSHNINNIYYDLKLFYLLCCNSFNYQIDFNSKNEFNSPFGKLKSCFNYSLEERIIEWNETFLDYNIKFYNEDCFKFLDIIIPGLTENDLVYLDPPYLVSDTKYNKKWNKEKEIKLLNYLDIINDKCKFALSNILNNNCIGVKTQNTILQEWSKKYNIYNIDLSYHNCNYQKQDKTKNTSEVLITNF